MDVTGRPYRAAACLTVTDSLQTGIVKSTLSNYENDKKPDINLGALEKLAALYGVGLDYLLGLTENKKTLRDKSCGPASE